MATLKYSVVTFGCRVNQADSLRLEGSLRARGAISTSPDEADLVVVNTCSVTATADQGARQTIRRIARSNPAVRIVVTGCYATRRPEELRALPNVTHVVTNPFKDDLLSLSDLPSLSTARRYGDGDGPCGALEPGVAGRTAFTMRVQTGCEQRCSYCIIPTTRGAGRSLPLADITRELAHVVAAGYKEIIITGVHLGSYGRDLGDGATLATLVRRLAEWDADVLFRVSSLEPMDCTDEIVDLVAASPRLAPHFHLPLQHGADSVLNRMRRPYTAGGYRHAFDGSCPMRRLDPTSSWDSPARATPSSTRQNRCWVSFLSRICTYSRTRIGRARMRARWSERSTGRRFASVVSGCGQSVTRYPRASANRKWERCGVR
jgi:threonylcarbamoyladenosine tRNA methylthiotransferase MtaB